MVPAAVDNMLAPAHLARLCLAKVDLAGQEARKGDLVDTQQPSVAEVKLIVAPVSALRSRVRQLLEDWPGNPLLEQLVAICGRLLGELEWPESFPGKLFAWRGFLRAGSLSNCNLYNHDRLFCCRVWGETWSET